METYNFYIFIKFIELYMWITIIFSNWWFGSLFCQSGLQNDYTFRRDTLYADKFYDNLCKKISANYLSELNMHQISKQLPATEMNIEMTRVEIFGRRGVTLFSVFNFSPTLVCWQ